MRSVVLQTLLQLLSAALLLYIRAQLQTGWLRVLAAVLAVLDLAGIPCGFLVLGQRMRELERGELDEARKY